MLAESKVKQQSRQQQGLVDQLKAQNEELNNLKNELYVRLESLKRDLQSRRSEMDSLTQMKEVELKSLKSAQDRETKTLNSEIEQLKLHKAALEKQMAEVNAKVQ